MSGLASITLSTSSVRAEETADQSSYPLKSENAIPLGDLSAYFSCAPTTAAPSAVSIAAAVKTESLLLRFMADLLDCRRSARNQHRTRSNASKVLHDGISQSRRIDPYTWHAGTYGRHSSHDRLRLRRCHHRIRLRWKRCRSPSSGEGLSGWRHGSRQTLG